MLNQTDRRCIPAALPRGVQVADNTEEIHGKLNDSALI